MATGAALRSGAKATEQPPEGADSGEGTLDSTVLRGVYDARGQSIAGARTGRGGEGDNARLVFIATETVTHYIGVRGAGSPYETDDGMLNQETPWKITGPLVDRMELHTDTASILGLGNLNKYRGKCVACETWVEIPPSETEKWGNLHKVPCPECKDTGEVFR